MGSDCQFDCKPFKILRCNALCLLLYDAYKVPATKKDRSKYLSMRIDLDEIQYDMDQQRIVLKVRMHSALLSFQTRLFDHEINLAATLFLAGGQIVCNINHA